jgi:hypothetical protein
MQYRSKDKVGNQEVIQTLTVKIDKTAPEAKFIFNPTTQQLDIIGQDNLSQPVAVTVADSVVSKNEDDHQDQKSVFDWLFRWKKEPEQEKITTATLTDEAGHITKVTFKKEKNQDRRIDITIRSIVYDGMVTNLKDTSLQYKWQTQKKTGKYTVLAAEAQTQDKQIESHYVPWRDKTYLMTRPQALDDEDGDNHFEFRPTWQVLKGMVIPRLETEYGKVKISY